MNISPINTNNYSKPSFGKIILLDKVPDSILKTLLNNPEITKLSQRLQEEGEDLFVSYHDNPLSDIKRIILVKGQRTKPTNESIEYINSTDAKDNSIETAIRNYSTQKRKSLIDKLKDIHNKVLSSLSSFLKVK